MQMALLPLLLRCSGKVSALAVAGAARAGKQWSEWLSE